MAFTGHWLNFSRTCRAIYRRDHYNIDTLGPVLKLQQKICSYLWSKNKYNQWQSSGMSKKLFIELLLFFRYVH